MSSYTLRVRSIPKLVTIETLSTTFGVPKSKISLANTDSSGDSQTATVTFPNSKGAVQQFLKEGVYLEGEKLLIDDHFRGLTVLSEHEDDLVEYVFFATSRHPGLSPLQRCFRILSLVVASLSCNHLTYIANIITSAVLLRSMAWMGMHSTPGRLHQQCGLEISYRGICHRHGLWPTDMTQSLAIPILWVG